MDLELRKQVATEVMGLWVMQDLLTSRVEGLSQTGFIVRLIDGDTLAAIPAYHTDIKAAWEVVEKMAEEHELENWMDIEMMELMAEPSHRAALYICQAALRWKWVGSRASEALEGEK